MSSVAITVFTPTFDRRDLLARVHQSLRAQTFRDFEWLIVDDGSSDGTAAAAGAWEAASDFPIRYIRQPHAGKHRAYNLAIREARGRLFAVLDSDDTITPRA